MTTSGVNIAFHFNRRYFTPEVNKRNSRRHLNGSLDHLCQIISIMAQIPDLTDISRMVVVQGLLGERESDWPQGNLQSYLIGLLGSDAYSPVSQSILEKIVREQPQKLTNEILLNLCPVHLRNLTLNSCTGVSGRGIAKTLDKCKKAQSLDMSRVQLPIHDSFFTFFQIMKDKSQQLTSLCLEGVESLTDRHVQSVLRYFTTLKQLNVSSCHQLSDRAFLIDEQLQLSREACAKAGGTMQWKSSLTSVDISGCGELTSTSVRHLTALCGPTLQNINISYTNIDSTALWYLSGYSLMSAIHMVHSLAKTHGHQVISDQEGTDKVLDELMVTTQQVSQMLQNLQKTPAGSRREARDHAQGDPQADSDGAPSLGVSTEISSKKVTQILAEKDVADTLVSALNKHEEKPLWRSLQTCHASSPETPDDSKHLDGSPRDTNTDRGAHGETALDSESESAESTQSENPNSDSLESEISKGLYSADVKNRESSQDFSCSKGDPGIKVEESFARESSDCDDSSIPDPFMVVETRDRLIVPVDSFKADDVSSQCESSTSDCKAMLNLEVDQPYGISDEELEGAVGGFELPTCGYEDVIGAEDTEFDSLYLRQKDLQFCEDFEAGDNRNDDDLIIDVIAMSNHPELSEKTESQEITPDDIIIDAIAFSNLPEKREFAEAQEIPSDDDLVIDAIAFSNQPRIEPIEEYHQPYNSLESDVESSLSSDSSQSTNNLHYTQDDSSLELCEVSESSLNRLGNREKTFDRLEKLYVAKGTPTRQQAEGVRARDKVFSKLREKTGFCDKNERGDFSRNADQSNEDAQYLFPKLENREGPVRDSGISAGGEKPESGISAGCEKPESGISAGGGKPESGISAGGEKPDSGISALGEIPESGISAGCEIPESGISAGGERFSQEPDTNQHPDGRLHTTGQLTASDNLFCQPAVNESRRSGFIPQLDFHESQNSGLVNPADATGGKQSVLQNQLDVSESQQTVLEKQLDADVNQQSVLEKQLDVSENQQSVLQNKLDVSESQQTVLEKQLDADISQQSVLEEQLDVKESQQSVLGNQLDASESQQSVLEKQLDISENQQSALQNQLDVKESRQSVLGKQLDVSEIQQSVLQNQLDFSESKKSVLENPLNVRESQQSALENQLHIGESKQSVLESQLDVSESQQSVIERPFENQKSAPVANEILSIESEHSTDKSRQYDVKRDPDTNKIKYPAPKSEPEACESKQRSLDNLVAVCETEITFDDHVNNAGAESRAVLKNQYHDVSSDSPIYDSIETRPMTNKSGKSETAHTTEDQNALSECQSDKGVTERGAEEKSPEAIVTSESTEQEVLEHHMCVSGDTDARFSFKSDTPYYKWDSMTLVSHKKEFDFDVELMRKQCEEDGDSSSSEDDLIMSLPQEKFSQDGVCDQQSADVPEVTHHCDENDNKLTDVGHKQKGDSLFNHDLIVEDIEKEESAVTLQSQRENKNSKYSESSSKTSQTQANASSASDNIQLFRPALTSIDMSSIVCHSKDLVKACVKALLLTNPGIQHLAMSWKELDDDLLRFVADHAPELCKISLLDCEGLTSMGVAYLCQKCPRLTSLNLRGVYFISDFALAPLMDDRGVTHLNLAETNITDISLRAFATKCPKLTELDLSWCEEIMEESTDAMETLVQSGSALQVFKLRHLPISDTCLFSLAAHCVNLNRLNLSNVNMCDSHLLSISLRCKQLRDLNVSWNSALTDLGCGAVLSHLINLEILDMSGIKQISSQPFLPIISDLPRWRKCQALFKFKHGERKVLKELDEESCFSDEDYDCLYLPCRSTVYAPCLRSLELQYSDKVNDEHLAELVAVCRGALQIKDYYGDWVTPMLLPSYP